MFLLAQFRDRRAYPWVIALCRLPHESVDALLGDTITEGLPRIIASVFDGDAGPIKSIIENAAVDEFVRGSALRSLSILVHEGALARADVVAYLTDLFRDKLEQEYSHVRDVVVSEALNLHATTLAEDIRAGYEAGLIDPGYIHPTSVERGFAMNEDAALARAKRRCGGLIDDVIREMHWWACFQPGGSSRSEAQLEFQPDRPESETVMRSAPKVGRNAPCPCGSGMKYKKCCGK